MPSQLRILLFGPPRVFLDHRLLTDFKSVKTQAILFYVTVARRPRSRPELAAMFWPEVTESRANTSLRTALSNLRRLVGDHLEITRRTVALNQNHDTVLDVTKFEELLKPGIGEVRDILQVETAVSLYAGEFLEGFHLPDAPLFEHWAIVERTRLQESLLNSLQMLALWHAERSEYQISLDYLAHLLALDPIRDVGHRLKIAVLAMSGQSGAALTHYDVCRRIRSEQLGLDPAPETAALYELILHDQFPKVGQPAIGELLADMNLGAVASSPTVNQISQVDASQLPAKRSVKVYWGDIPARIELYGRRQQVAQLAHWLTTERCRLVAILGIGGIGKTTLAAEVARLMAESGLEQLEDTSAAEKSSQFTDPPFDRVIWRSLVNVPPLADILNDWLQLLPDRKLSHLPDTLEGRLSLLLKELQHRRCLLILDNAESVLQSKAAEDPARLTQEAYLQLIRQIAETDHQSCLLLTSREVPPGLRQLAGDYPEIRLLRLGGLTANAGAAMLRFRGLVSTPEGLEAMVERYSGNPLALKLVAETVRELFAGEVADFLDDETPIFADIREVLDQQYERLSELEREILTWLAIEREPLPLHVLMDDLVHTPHRRQFLEALRSLQRRSLIEQYSRPDEVAPMRFSLQNVVLEYLASRLIESFCLELERGELTALQRYALVKAHTREYIENSQRRLLLRPVARWLTARLGQAGAIERLRDLLEALHAQSPRTPGYAGANILHLLLDMGVNVSGYDFSELAIWQADLRDISLLDVSFAGADLQDSLFRGAFGLVVALAISPEGQLLAAGSSDGSITLWELNEHQPHQTLLGHSGPINCIAFNNDGCLLASASFDQTVRLWDVRSGQTIKELTDHKASVLAVAFSPDGETLFSTGEDKTVRIWGVHSGPEHSQLLADDNTSFAAAVSPDGESFVCGGTDGSISVWDIHTRKLTKSVYGHDGKIRSVVFTPDGKILATAGEDDQINLWHVQEMARAATLTGHDNWVFSIAFNNDGRKLASASADKTVRIWDVQSGRTLRVLHDCKNWVTSVAFNPVGDVVAAGSYDRRIRLWDVPSARLVHTLRGSLRWVDEVIYSPDDKLLASATFDKPVLLWDARTGQLVHQLQGHSGSIRCLAFSPDGKTVAGGSDDQTVRLWDTLSGELSKTLHGHTGFVRTLAFSPDGQSLATSDLDGNLHIWQKLEGQPLISWSDVSRGVKRSISFSPVGRLLAFGCTDHTIRLVDAVTGHIHATLSGHQTPVQLVRFSEDGSLLASRSEDGVIHIWNLKADIADARQSHIQWTTSADSLWNIAISPNGRLLAAQLNDALVGIWDLRDGKLCFSIEQHLMGEGCLAFSRDGASLIIGTSDGAVHLWNAEKGVERQTLKGHNGPITYIAVGHKDQRIASSSTDGQIRVWDLESGACLNIMTPPGPYMGMDISGTIGLTQAQKATLQTLGAVGA